VYMRMSEEVKSHCASPMITNVTPYRINHSDNASGKGKQQDLEAQDIDCV
jgi:hypothetical protein